MLRSKHYTRGSNVSTTSASQPLHRRRNNPPPPFSVPEADPPPMYQLPDSPPPSLSLRERCHHSEAVSGLETPTQTTSRHVRPITPSTIPSATASQSSLAISVSSPTRLSPVPVQVPPIAHIRAGAYPPSPYSQTSLTPVTHEPTQSSPPPDFDSIDFDSPLSVNTEESLPMPPADLPPHP